MSPIEVYQKQCQLGMIHEDQAQLVVLQKLQEIYHALIREAKHRQPLLAVVRKPKSVDGAYIWGGVGIGKTFMMDCFFQALPFPEKLRMHFHQFMQFIHRELKILQGKKDPLQWLAKNLARKNIVICFDEFVVTDIVDAMLLGRLFRLLFSYGVCLVTTSNTAPDDLYKHGLQRPLFLPAITALKKHTNIMHVTTETDYRMQAFKHSGFWYTPDDQATQVQLKHYFNSLVKDAQVSQIPIQICQREIKIVCEAEKIIWFDFNKICMSPRSQQDYLEIARLYSTVFISHIPVIPAYANNMINLFIRLVDVLYDAQTRLVVSAAVSIDEIYPYGRFWTDFQRTRSRLHEMQTWDVV